MTTELPTAMLDRLPPWSTVVTIEGESYRMRAQREREEQLRKGASMDLRAWCPGPVLVSGEQAGHCSYIRWYDA